MVQNLNKPVGNWKKSNEHACSVYWFYSVTVNQYKVSTYKNMPELLLFEQKLKNIITYSPPFL